MVSRAGLVRKDGVLTPVPAGSMARSVDFGSGPTHVVAIPWGDLATAYRSTGIPNIETYIALSPVAQTVLRGADALSGLASGKFGQAALKRLVGLLPEGPGEASRAAGYALLWCEVTDDAGNRAVSRMRTPHAYTLTAIASLEVARRVLAGDAPPGYQTPASAYGPDLVMEVGGVTREDL